jgi:hypothetical protein
LQKKNGKRTVMNQLGNSKFPPIGHLIFFFYQHTQ